ncbi:MAG TPA: CBS domain-containing protein [Oligoflexus sp.]|uniref:CBS domain-containing protein n=1 Tax=Oligoflexus sp. TaxID=1971216 RepID=UPI002D7EF0FA|nr:CBS domain-containing protein [Oligoflexus sp.]HET9235620.1 CBS domain-containing protein [Oligoflexus sp.]
MTHLKALCNRHVVHIDTNASVLEAAQLMREKHVGDVVVVDGDRGILRPIGMLTDRDIVTLVVGEDVNAETVKVGDVMAHNPRVIHQLEDVSTAIECMSEAGVRRLPIVDERGSLVGIVTADDLHQLLARMQNQLSSISSQQIVHEVTGATLVNRFS